MKKYAEDNFATAYYWQNLPQEIKDKFWQFALKRFKSAEKADDFINRHNFFQTIDEWENLIDIKEE